MHDNFRLVEQRVDRFIAERITPALYRDREALSVNAWHAPGEPVPFSDARSQDYLPFAAGDRWGAPWSTTWFHLNGAVPERWLTSGGLPDGTRAEVYVDLGFNEAQTGFQAEGLGWSADGHVLKSIQPRNRHLDISDGSVNLYVEAAGNPMIAGGGMSFAPTPMGDKTTAPSDPLYVLRAADIVLLDLTVWELQQDVWVLMGLVKELQKGSTRRARVLRALEAMVDAIDPHDVAGTAVRGREALAPVLADPSYASAHQVYAVGHAHIDSAWLWPVRETVRKCARTFSNQLALMDENPDFKFVASSAQQYAWIEERYPELFERIRSKVASGQFVPVGSMWVESDTNLPGGEALARQFVAGKQYFQSRFGIDTTDVWLPDSFGYTGALPQLMRAAGCRDFLSQKLSWNEVDRMPHHTFWWQGIDGSRVFTHFPPVDTYNSDLSPRELLHAENEYAEKGVARTSIVPFGWGDGGGGPTREMLAAASRQSDLEGVPAVRLASPSEFYRDARDEYEHAPTWVGEMYLEFHRGTYTSQARMKQGNRRSEHLLREAELWAATAAVRVGLEYPYEILERIWHQVLLYQFHDILPGSSIGWVHREAEETYPLLAAELEQIIVASARALVGEGELSLELNATPTTRRGVAALGAGEPHTTPSGIELERTSDGGIVVTNDVVRVEMSPEGLITSLIDLVERREVIPRGTQANLLQLHLDTPKAWDAWDVDVEYKRFVTDLTSVDSIEAAVEGPVATVRIVRSFGSSRVEQTIRVEQGSAAIEIVNDIDWHEKQKMLKLAFPVDLMTERSAAETQFGHVFRPTHANTSWDANKFEICAHRWVRVEEAGYGVSVANSATYGHDIALVTPEQGRPYTAIRMSLLRSAQFPDPRADEGRHVLTAVLHPGAALGTTIEDGYRANLDVRTIKGEHGVEPLVALDAPGVMIESVKLAEDGSGDVVVRLYEALGGRGRGTLTPQFEVSHITQVDLLERASDPEGVEIQGSQVALELSPFQIVTLRMRSNASR